MSGTTGIHVSPSLWNCDRLPVEEETRLLYFFKLIYMERLRQLKKWGDQRHPDGTNAERFRRQARLYKLACQRHAAESRVTWIDIFLEEAFELAETECPPGAEAVEYAKEHGLGDMESEMVQSAAVLAAWHSDKCRSSSIRGYTPALVALSDQGIKAEMGADALREVIQNFRSDMGQDSPMATDDGGASAYGLGLPGARPRGEEVVITPIVCLGRTQQRAPGQAAELGDTVQVAWCTGKEPIEPNTTTRLVNLANCEQCLQIWFGEPPVKAKDSDWVELGKKREHRDETRG